MQTEAVMGGNHAPLLSMAVQIGRLALCRQSLTTYYEMLIGDEDPVLHASAIAALLELFRLPEEHWPLAVTLSRYGMVKTRAFRFFLGQREYGLIKQVLEQQPTNLTELLGERMAAEFACDFERMTAHDAALFLETGDIAHLQNARVSAEHAGGWKEALPYAVRALLAHPANADGPFMLLTLLHDANQMQLLQDACTAFQSAGVYPNEVAIFSAEVMVYSGQPKDALKRLLSVPLNGLSNKLAVRAAQLRAEAFDATGDFGQAHAAYVKQNALDKRPDLDPKRFTQGILERAAYKFPSLPADPKAYNHFMMLGFPRSGTTLLENALGAHRQLETCEEVPALGAARSYVQRHVSASGIVTEEVAMVARDRYYTEIDRWRRDPTALIVVDKMPIYSAEAVFLDNLFPEHRYIFSIRHPYDVVLSCFRQMFAPNETMENFRTLEGACRLYDFSMEQWFGEFKLEEDERVIYVRYKELVDNFEETVTEVFRFLGTDWDPRVADFAKIADSRASKTPSYQKVRSGLKIGVQSSWRKYYKQFKPKERELLDKWVDFFGYTTDA